MIGTAKNVGKTVTFNALRAAALRRGITGGVSSIGRDGEPSDALDGAAKPRVRLEANTIVALPRELLPRSPGLCILDIGEASALGTMVFARVLVPLECEIGGAPTARGVRATIDRLCELGGTPAFIDGAIDRIAPLAGGADAIVLATGAASGATIAAVADVVGEAVRRLGIPGRSATRERTRVVEIARALGTLEAEALLAQPHDATVVVSDPTRITVRGRVFERLLNAFDVRCERPLRVVGITTCSVGRTTLLDPRELAHAVAARTQLPTFDLVANLGA